MKFEVCHSLSEFDQWRSDWDRLWANSTLGNPLVRSGPLVSAIEYFFGDAEVRIFIGFEEQLPVVGIPLVRTKLHQLLPVYSLPNNPWGRWGDLIVSPYAPESWNLELTHSIRSNLQDGVYLPDVSDSSGGWAKLIGALADSSVSTDVATTGHVGLIAAGENYNRFSQRLSKGFRRKLQKYRRGLEAVGAVSFEQHFNFRGKRSDVLVEEAFELEQKTWKGAEGSAVIASGHLEFMKLQARMLAATGNLRISFLRIDERIIAFEFGVAAKQVYYSHKIGFDPEFRRFAPGQLLTDFLVRTMHQSSDYRMIDTVGTVSAATAKWSTGYLTHKNFLISGTGLAARACFQVLKSAKNIKRRLRPDADPECPDPITPVSEKPASSRNTTAAV